MISKEEHRRRGFYKETESRQGMKEQIIRIIRKENDRLRQEFRGRESATRGCHREGLRSSKERVESGGEGATRSGDRDGLEKSERGV